jgi:hypothetical protein
LPKASSTTPPDVCADLFLRNRPRYSNDADVLESSITSGSIINKRLEQIFGRPTVLLIVAKPSRSQPLNGADLKPKPERLRAEAGEEYLAAAAIALDLHAEIDVRYQRTTPFHAVGWAAYLGWIWDLDNAISGP